jgi:hypothetical protein
MTQNFSFHNSNVTPPPKIPQDKLIPIILRLKDNYNLWQQILAIFPKANRFTLGSKIDEIFLKTIEYCFLASYASNQEKIILIDRGSARIDLLKLFLQLAWEIKAIENNQYTNISHSIYEIGRMLGGWKKSLLQKTPENISREK